MITLSPCKSGFLTEKDDSWITEDHLINKSTFRTPFILEMPVIKNELNAHNEYYQRFNDRVVTMNIRKYFKELSEKFNEITMTPEILGNMPVIEGTRIPVSLIISCLRDDMSIDEICEDYRLERKAVEEALNFVKEILNNPFHGE